MEVISSYVPADDEIILSDSTKKHHFRLYLLEMAPMGKIEDQDGKFSSNDEKITQFNALSHVQFLSDIFKFSDKNLIISVFFLLQTMQALTPLLVVFVERHL